MCCIQLDAVMPVYSGVAGRIDIPGIFDSPGKSTASWVSQLGRFSRTAKIG